MTPSIRRAPAAPVSPASVKPAPAVAASPRPVVQPPAARPPMKAAAPAPTGPVEGFRWLDVAGASTLVVGAAFGAYGLPPGPLRMALALSLLLFAPGYLLLQAFVVPAARGTALLWQALASVGLSPALVGLFALATSVVQGGFSLGAIVILVTLGSLGMGVAALVRRRALVRAATAPKGTPKTLAQPLMSAQPAPAEAARAKSGTTRP